MPLKILVTGAKGRMGKAVTEAVGAEPGTEVGAAIDVGDSLADGVAACDTVIDFTTHTFTGTVLDAAVAAGKPLVIGTTGHTPGELAAITGAAGAVPIVFAPNYSVGVNTLFWLTRKACEILGDNFDLEVIEMHHRHKTDSPSGTAKRLAEVLAEARGLRYDDDVQHGRFGNIGARKKNEIGMHALRGGDVVGDHTVVFSADGERVELTHKASSRLTFASGAVRAALWLQGKGPGLYDMQDVLELKA